MAVKRFSTLKETPLHAALKSWYGGPGASYEVPVDGYIVDCVTDGLLVEIQTANFSAIRRKIEVLLVNHRVRVVYPVTAERWIIRTDAGPIPGRRKSPKRGRIVDIFVELVAFAHLVRNPNFSLDAVVIREEEVRHAASPKRRRRRDWGRKERRLIEVLEHRLFRGPEDFRELMPEGIEDPFTTADISRAGAMPRWLAQKMVYCLRAMGEVQPVSRRRAGVLYERTFAD